NLSFGFISLKFKDYRCSDFENQSERHSQALYLRIYFSKDDNESLKFLERNPKLRFLVYQRPRAFHQREPNPIQIKRKITLTIAPIDHHVFKFTYSDPYKIGAQPVP